jgi:uncharacterized membrane protein
LYDFPDCRCDRVVLTSHSSVTCHLPASNGENNHRFLLKHNGLHLVINIMFLMATCLVPFSTSLLGEYREQQISILVYGSNSIIIASLLYVQWRYVTTTSHHGRLLDENLDPIIKTTLSRRTLFGIIVYLIAIGFSFVYTQLSPFLFALVLIPAFLPNKTIHKITFGRSHEKIR